MYFTKIWYSYTFLHQSEESDAKLSWFSFLTIFLPKILISVNYFHLCILCILWKSQHPNFIFWCNFRWELKSNLGTLPQQCDRNYTYESKSLWQASLQGCQSWFMHSAKVLIKFWVLRERVFPHSWTDVGQYCLIHKGWKNWFDWTWIETFFLFFICFGDPLKKNQLLIE